MSHALLEERIIENDIPQETTAAVSRRCTSLNLRRAARAASAFLEAYLEPVGLHSSQFGILSRISTAGSLTITDLSDQMFLDRTTLTRNLQVLQREKLVAVIPGSDRRVREVTLTDLGREMLKRAIPLWEQAETALEAKLGSANQAALLEIVKALSRQ